MSDRPLADALVYDALLEFGIGGGDYTANIADLSTVAGVPAAQTTRSLQALVEQGALEFTGRRRGRTAIWRRGKNPPSPSTGSRTPEGRGYPPTGGYPGPSEEYVAAGRTPPEGVPSASDSGQDEARRTDNEIAALVENSRINAYGILDTLQGDDDLGPPDLDRGDCGECRRDAPARWSLGRFQLCRECRRRRANATKTSGAGGAGNGERRLDRTAPEDLPLDDETRELVRDLIAQTQTNGNRPDDPFDLLEEAPY